MILRDTSNDRRSGARRRARLTTLRALLRSRRGASRIEYGMILAFIVLAMFGALQAVAGQTTTMWDDIATRVTTAR